MAMGHRGPDVGWVGGPFANANLGPFFSRAVSGVDADPNLVHMEAQDLNGGKRGGARSQVSLSALARGFVLGSWPCMADRAVL